MHSRISESLVDDSMYMCEKQQHIYIYYIYIYIYAFWVWSRPCVLAARLQIRDTAGPLIYIIYTIYGPLSIPMYICLYMYIDAFGFGCLPLAAEKRTICAAAENKKSAELCEVPFKTMRLGNNRLGIPIGNSQ